MPESYEQPSSTDDFLCKSFLRIALVCLVILPPFAINNFVQQRYLLGVGSGLIVAIFAFQTWSIVRRDRYYAALTLLGLIPTILSFLSLCLLTQGMIGILWCYPAAVSFYFMLPEKKAWLANTALLGIVFSLGWRIADPALTARMIATLLLVSIFSMIFIRVISEQQQQLKIQAVTDPLTGLLNRTLMANMLTQALEQSKRTDIPMTLVAFDIDRFKRINDTFGHDAGDAVLRGIGKMLRTRSRCTDKIFRLGGEEFLVLLYGTNAKNGQQFAEDLRLSIASLPLLPDHPVTISAGIATLNPKEDWREWMKRSDENLYRAKRGGRNRSEL
ncbi:MAG: GGDEF domain-containing protein [Phormidesmis sp.]